jgi:hypothetical protein
MTLTVGPSRHREYEQLKIETAGIPSIAHHDMRETSAGCTQALGGELEQAG